MNWCVQTPISRQTKWQTQSSAVGCVVYIHIYVYTICAYICIPIRDIHITSYILIVLWYLHFFEVRSEFVLLKSFILRPDYYIYPINVDQICPVIFHCHGGFYLHFCWSKSPLLRFQSNFFCSNHYFCWLNHNYRT